MSGSKLKTINLDKDQHRRLAILAVTKGTTIREEVQTAIDKHLAKKEKKLEKGVAA